MPFRPVWILIIFVFFGVVIAVVIFIPHPSLVMVCVFAVFVNHLGFVVLFILPIVGVV